MKEYIIAIFALIVFVYRFIMLLIPMLLEGLKLGDTKKVLESFTLLV